MAGRRRGAGFGLALCVGIGGALLDAPAARACPSCQCGNPTLTAAGLEKPYKNRVRIALDVRLGEHGSGLYPTDQHVLLLRETLTVFWSPIARLTVVGQLPLSTMWIRSPDHATASLTGLGDAELSLRGVVFRDGGFSPHHLLSLNAGVKLPTGPRIADAQGYPWPEDDQPGSGSINPFGGLSYAWFHDELMLFGSASWRQTTPGYRGWQRGSELGGTVGVQIQPHPRFAIGVSLDGRYALADTFPAVDGTSGRTTAPDTGGTSLGVTPNLLVGLSDRFLLRAAVQAHVWDRWNGHQSESASATLALVVDLN